MQTLEERYARLRRQTFKHYSKHPQCQQLLMDKIEALQLLEKEYPEKKSIQQAFDILDNISKKNFKNINSKIARLETTTRSDVKEASFIRSCISFCLLPILLPFILLQILLEIAVLYEFMLLMQITLLATAITLTMAFLPPLMLLATIPAAIILNSLLSTLVIDSFLERIGTIVDDAFSFLFYETNEQLKNELDGIGDSAKEIQSQVEGSYFTRALRSILHPLATSCETSEHEEAQGLACAV